MSNPSVTVIVPVYNVSAYIEKCARSVFEQTLESLEILFVDDCSPDDSALKIEKILELYPHRQSLTRIIRSESNGGSATARMIGIVEAKGDYVIHLDGDDWVDKEYYGALMKKALETDADIVVGDEVMEYPGRTVSCCNSSLPTSGKEIVKDWYRNSVGFFCHNKLVRRSLYTDNGILPWKGLNMWEDNGLFARLFYRAGKVAQAHGPVYHYNRCNVTAMTAGYGIKQVEQMIGIAINLDEFFKSKPDAEDFRQTADAFKFLAKLNLITDSFHNYRRFRALFRESDYISSSLDPRAFSSRGLVRFKMVKWGLAPVFILLFKLKNKLGL